jgi:gliding motility-associated-like protein
MAGWIDFTNVAGECYRTYWVRVTDSNGCRNTDTSMIKTVHPVPVGFLPDDTTICSYGNIVLAPSASFKTYQWNTGSTTPSVTVTQPGMYSLQVEDVNGCKGAAAVVVSLKDCIKGFFVPTAFTPNGDRKNDRFRPMLFGKVKQYRFTVYNRWGQVVFHSTKPEEGWDGKLAGNAQATFVFVWTCSYQFEGEPLKNEKGTVTLIR